MPQTLRALPYRDTSEFGMQFLRRALCHGDNDSHYSDPEVPKPERISGNGVYRHMYHHVREGFANSGGEEGGAASGEQYQVGLDV